MHICFLTNEYPRPGIAHGGIGSFLKVICPALAKTGIEVSVINGTSGQREVVWSEGVRIIYVPFSYSRGMGWFFNNRAIDREIERLNQENPIDILEGSEMSFSFLQKRCGIINLIRLHGGHHFFAVAEKRKFNQWKAFQEKRSFKKADCFIGVSEFVVSETSKYLPIEPKPIKVIMNPINLDLFKGSGFDKIIPFNIVFAGTIIEKKGIRQLCQAMGKIVQKFPEARLNVYGRDWTDSDGNSFLQKLLKSIPVAVNHHIVFHGPVNQTQLPSIFERAHICAFPSHAETLGLVAPEAMAMERAVLYTQEGPGAEVIEQGVSGWLCNPYDPMDIADKIIEIFSDDSEMKRRAIEARKKVNVQFNISNILTQNIEFYQQMSERKNQR